MTSYHGGKQRIGGHLAKYIHYVCSLLPKEIELGGYCEPFVGMCGVYRHIPGLFAGRGGMKYLAGDTNESVIEMWREVQGGWRPPVHTTEAEYNSLRESPPSALRGYIGHQYSFGGQFFMGYSTKYGKNPDSSRARRNVVEIGKCLGDVEFRGGSYKQFSNLKKFIIYCDSPYEKSSQRYRMLDGFVSEEFWDWCREMSRENVVFVSSYEDPEDFMEVLSSSHKLTEIIHSNAPRKRVEKLFLLIGSK